MNLDVSKWKTFQVGRVFMMLNGKGITQEEIADNEGDFLAVQSGEENNGVMGKISLDYCKIMQYTFSEKPCLTVARSGSAGFVSFQIHGCVVGDSAKILLLPDEVATKEVYTFLQSVLTANRFKYTYGRKVTEEKYLNEWIKLPVQHNSDKTVFIDETHKYSDEGFVPDWQFMENYIKSLHHKPLKTKNEPGQVKELNISNWKTFRVGDILDCDSTILSIKDELSEGNIPFVSRTAENNGIDGYVEVERDKITEGNCITIGAEGIYAFYQSEPFATGNKVYQIRRRNMNRYIGLFLATVLNLEDYRYSYGRARIMSKLKDENIKLPVDLAGNPDWQFMEDYIKALPYGDRLNG